MTRCNCETEEKTLRKGCDDTIDDVLDVVRAMLERGYLPSIKKFVLVGFVYSHEPDHITFQNLYKADTVERLVTSYPCALKHDGWQYEWWMRFKANKIDSAIDLVAKAAELQDLVEGAVWDDYENRSACPEICSSSLIIHQRTL